MSSASFIARGGQQGSVCVGEAGRRRRGSSRGTSGVGGAVMRGGEGDGDARIGRLRVMANRGRPRRGRKGRAGGRESLAFLWRGAGR